MNNIRGFDTSIQPEYKNEQADAGRVQPDGMGWLNPSRETIFSGAYRDRGIFIFHVQLTTSNIAKLTRLIHTLLYAIHYSYIHTSTVEDECPIKGYCTTLFTFYY